jgi:hypothetical protein
MGADLHAWVEFSTPFGTVKFDIVPEMHPHFDLPIASADKFPDHFQIADAIMADHASQNPADAGWNFSDMTTLRGDPIPDGRGFVAACLATAPPDQPPPPSSWTPGSPGGFPMDYQLCNFCIASAGYVDPTNNSSVPASTTTVMPSSPPASWTCNVRSNGCFDVCLWDFSSGTGSVVISQAAGPTFCNRPQ